MLDTTIACQWSVNYYYSGTHSGKSKGQTEINETRIVNAFVELVAICLYVNYFNIATFTGYNMKSIHTHSLRYKM